MASYSCEELHFLGRRVGLASYASGLVEKCPVAAAHHDSSYLEVSQAYRRFPCSLCHKEITDSKAETFAYCMDCWRLGATNKNRP